MSEENSVEQVAEQSQILREQEVVYSTFNRHAATALVCLTAEFGAADCVFGRVGRGVMKSVLLMVYYVLFLIGTVLASTALLTLSWLIFLVVEIIATVDSYRISCADSVEQAFTDRKGRIVRGHKWGLSFAIPRTILCVLFLVMLVIIACA